MSKAQESENKGQFKKLSTMRVKTNFLGTMIEETESG